MEEHTAYYRLIETMVRKRFGVESTAYPGPTPAEFCIKCDTEHGPEVSGFLRDSTDEELRAFAMDQCPEEYAAAEREWMQRGFFAVDGLILDK